MRYRLGYTHKDHHVIKETQFQVIMTSSKAIAGKHYVSHVGNGNSVLDEKLDISLLWAKI